MRLHCTGFDNIPNVNNAAKWKILEDNWGACKSGYSKGADFSHISVKIVIIRVISYLSYLFAKCIFTVWYGETWIVN